MLDSDAIQSLYETARAAWPGVHVDRDTFSARASAVADPASLAIDDLYLALACADGDTAGIAAFESERFPEVKRALARLRLDDATADDIAQRVRTKVLVGDGSPARIQAYTGRGGLAGWLRAVAVHEALDQKRADK